MTMKTETSKLSRVVFSSGNDEWTTPEATYAALDAEFHFADDACPLGGDANGLMREWLSPCFVNPPYSSIYRWMEKALLEFKAGKTVVVLVPSRTDTRWFHRFCLLGEIRFIQGRLKFGGHKNSAPFPSMVVIFKPEQSNARAERVILPAQNP
jgi:hypothetical protein